MTPPPQKKYNSSKRLFEFSVVVAILQYGDMGFEIFCWESQITPNLFKGLQFHIKRNPLCEIWHIKCLLGISQVLFLFFLQVCASWDLSSLVSVLPSSLHHSKLCWQFKQLLKSNSTDKIQVFKKTIWVQCSSSNPPVWWHGVWNFLLRVQDNP